MNQVRREGKKKIGVSTIEYVTGGLANNSNVFMEGGQKPLIARCVGLGWEQTSIPCRAYDIEHCS